ncbi:MAG: hypothetical protein WD360_04655 [Nitriliruptoraceae bacterium]
MPAILPEPTLTVRFIRLAAGVLICGAGIAFMIAADLGLGPWDVLHQGMARRTNIPVGRVVILVGFVVLLLWIPLRQRPGIGTVANVLGVGTTIDLTLALLPNELPLGWRVVMLLLGPIMFAFGSGLYIGVALGAGPRDGLMTGITLRFNIPIWITRSTLEISALTTGWLLGGTVGIGTVYFALGIGPMVALALRHLAITGPFAIDRA